MVVAVAVVAVAAVAGRRKRSVTARKIGMLAGATGLPPMVRVLAEALSDEHDPTEFSLLCQTHTEEEILMRPTIEHLAKAYPSRLKVWYAVNQPDDPGLGRTRWEKWMRPSSQSICRGQNQWTRRRSLWCSCAAQAKRSQLRGSGISMSSDSLRSSGSCSKIYCTNRSSRGHDAHCPSVASVPPRSRPNAPRRPQHVIDREYYELRPSVVPCDRDICVCVASVVLYGRFHLTK